MLWVMEEKVHKLLLEHHVAHLISSHHVSTGSFVYITNSLHGFERQKQKTKNYYNAFVGESTKVSLEAICIVKLGLTTVEGNQDHYECHFLNGDLGRGSLCFEN